MKLKSLFLGSATAVGLSTGAFAADLATVVSSFDVCENLGMSGLTISSSDDCLQISGGVTYEFNWGDYNVAHPLTAPVVSKAGFRDIMDNGNTGVADQNLDWRSRLDWWLQFVGAASSDFGTAKAVIKLADNDHQDATGTNETVVQDTTEDNAYVKEAYVSIGDTTKIVAGRRDSSVYQDGDDEPFGFIGMFNSDGVDKGVNVFDYNVTVAGLPVGGRSVLPLKNHVIQLYHTIGDSGVTVSAGLENLFGANNVVGNGTAGTAVGTIAYAGDSFTGHISAAAGGILDGTIEDWKMHAGATATLDNFKIRGAFSGGSVGSGTLTSWNGLLSGEATFDMFTISAGIEGGVASGFTTFGTWAGVAAPVAGDVVQWGGNLTASAAVTDTVTIAAGFRWIESDANDVYTTIGPDTATWHAALKLIAKVTETLTATGEVGYYDIGNSLSTENPFYGSAELAWAPGGQFTSSVKGEVNSLGAYKATFKAAKTFD
jgi:hypothetical protein